MEGNQIINVERIKSIMTEQYSIKTLAQSMKISEYRLRRFLNGADLRRVKADVLYQLAVVLKIKTQSLFFEDYL
jgi:transcriptional regulator with XRE-family HTH domain